MQERANGTRTEEERGTERKTATGISIPQREIEREEDANRERERESQRDKEKEAEVEGKRGRVESARFLVRATERGRERQKQ